MEWNEEEVAVFAPPPAATCGGCQIRPAPPPLAVGNSEAAVIVLRVDTPLSRRCERAGGADSGMDE
jgi:hypothetical protein